MANTELFRDSKPSVELVTDRLEKPSLDDRSYRIIRLPNKLEALLVHDPDTDKASAALDVNVGSFSDADDMPGMAHAVEHLLFMGTEKYPVENAYNQYLTNHSGYSNAYTAATSTNYYFEVSAAPTKDAAKPPGVPADAEVSPLYGAMDRFAQFFISPLFLENTLDRELKAVDSENKKNLQSDRWRLNQLNKSLSNPQHPYHHFSTGNLETLRDEPRKRGIQIRNEFMKFHEKHYSANRMKLVVLGRESLDELETWVQELFSEVRNKDLPQNRWDGIPPMIDKDLLTQVFAKPVMDTRSLDIYFPYQDEEELYESHPSRYISHLIGHEGPGSILAYIKAKGWANGLSAGAMSLCPGSALFTISVSLTEDGLKNYMEIVNVVFQYIALIKETPPQEWIVDEMKRMAEVDFRFRQKSPASKFTSRLSAVMQKPLPREWLLSDLIRKFDPEAIKRGLSYLRPDNFKINIVSQRFPGDWDQKERWYGTEYKVEKIPTNFLEDIKKAASSGPSERLEALHLPHKNEFIPTRLGVDKKEVEEPAKTPKLLRNDDGIRVWWKKDDQFWVPKANVFITLRNPLASVTAKNSIIAKLYCKLVKDALVEYSYDAEIAGLDYHVDSHSDGFDIVVSGYNDKMSVLLEKVLVSMRDLEVKQDRFDIEKERLIRAYRNFDYQDPYRQIGEFTRWLNSEKGWITDEQLAELPDTTAEDVKHFFPQILSQNHIEALIHGNMYKEDALKIVDLVESVLKPRALPQSQWPIRRSLLFPRGSNYVYPRTLKDPANINHCIEYFLFVSEKTDRNLRAKLLLFAQTTDEPAFNQLRTKEQLGYVVFSGVRTTSTTMGYRIIIQSEKTTEYLEKRIDSLLANFEKKLEEMTADEFEGHKRSLINSRLEKLKNLTQESDRFWGQIGGEYFDFEQVYHDAAHIKPLTKADLVAFYKEYISPSSPSRAKLAVHMLAQSTPADLASRIPNEQQTESVIGMISQYLTADDITTDPSALSKRLASVDIPGGDQAGIIAGIKAFLTEDLKLPADKVNPIIEQGTVVLSTLLPQLGIVTQGTEEKQEADTEVQVSSKPVVIEQVHEYKAAVPLSKGARPVVDLSVFEEVKEKL